MKKLLFFLLILLSLPAIGQDRSKFLYADFADKSVTLYPFYKPVGNNFDPAVTLGGGLEYKQKGNLTLFQTAQVTGFSTEILGDGVSLTSSLGYRYSKSSGLFAEGMIGLGTSLFLSTRQTFTQDENGEYTPTDPLHIVAALPIDILLGYGGGKLSVYIKYRYMVIGPITKIMPVLPNSLFGLGIRYTINTKGE